MFASVLREKPFGTMKEFSTNAVVGVSTGKKQYVPPQIEVVELERQTMLLAGSPSAGFGSSKMMFNDISDEEWDD